MHHQIGRRKNYELYYPEFFLPELCFRKIPRRIHHFYMPNKQLYHF